MITAGFPKAALCTGDRVRVHWWFAWFAHRPPKAATVIAIGRKGVVVQWDDAPGVDHVLPWEAHVTLRRFLPRATVGPEAKRPGPKLTQAEALSILDLRRDLTRRRRGESLVAGAFALVVALILLAIAVV